MHIYLFQNAIPIDSIVFIPVALLNAYLFAIFMIEDLTSFLKLSQIEDSYFFIEVSEKKPNQEKVSAYIISWAGPVRQIAALRVQRLPL